MKKIKFEELKELIELPYKVLSLLLEIKEAEAKNKRRLHDYEIHKDSIKEDYDHLERLIKGWNENYKSSL